ncbi:hypothetical protein Adt_33949 [Abeliophyllum distichum]|uniref:Laccase n=1 Tax=Abeliophyllum distichum TaxID=126358 RepID=A0ABD1QZP6_9LAMI
MDDLRLTAKHGLNPKLPDTFSIGGGLPLATYVHLPTGFLPPENGLTPNKQPSAVVNLSANPNSATSVLHRATTTPTPDGVPPLGDFNVVLGVADGDLPPDQACDTVVGNSVH